MEFIGLIPDGCPACSSGVKIFAMVETIISRGRCVTITLRCVKCPWDREKYVKLSLMTAK